MKFPWLKAAVYLKQAGLSVLALTVALNLGACKSTVADEQNTQTLDLHSDQVCVLQASVTVDARTRVLQSALGQVVSNTPGLTWHWITVESVSPATTSASEGESYVVADSVQAGLSAQSCLNVISLEPALYPQVVKLAGQQVERNFISIAAGDDDSANFVNTGTDATGLSNLVTFDFDLGQAAFLVGYAAAGVSQQGYLGVIAQQNATETADLTGEAASGWADAFAQGVAFYNAYKGSDIQVKNWDQVGRKVQFLPASQISQQLSELAEAQVDYLLWLGDYPSEETWQQLAEHEIAVIWAGEDAYQLFSSHSGLIFNSLLVQPLNYLEQLVTQLQDDSGKVASYLGDLANQGIGLAD